MTDETSDTQDHQIDLNSLDILVQLAGVHQDGNYLVGITTQGVTFRQRIPSNKILNKSPEGRWILEDMRLL